MNNNGQNDSDLSSLDPGSPTQTVRVDIYLDLHVDLERHTIFETIANSLLCNKSFNDYRRNLPCFFFLASNFLA